MKQLTKFTLLLFLITLTVSSCTEDKYADWKILNDKAYEATLDTTDFIKSESGLCYKIIHAGENPKRPNVNSYVSVRYTGKLITGKVFDSGIYSGRLSGVVSGWQEAIVKLKVGGSMEMFFPYSLGYGTEGSGTIPPYSMLHFTVELLEAQY